MKHLRCAGELAGTATGYAFVVHGFACLRKTRSVSTGLGDYTTTETRSLFGVPPGNGSKVRANAIGYVDPRRKVYFFCPSELN
eukprot:scaffold27599_cov53-Phaeocystis_antarctica.AAC.1